MDDINSANPLKGCNGSSGNSVAKYRSCAKKSACDLHGTNVSFFSKKQGFTVIFKELPIML